jgi:alanine racemase
MVKADAYGHGASQVAACLAEAGCRHFSVVSVDEAAQLRAAGRDEEILVLGGVHDAAEAEAAVGAGLVTVLHHPGQLELVAEAAGNAPAAVHVEVDTGMRRMGVPPDAAAAFLERVAAEPRLRLAGVYTHLARAEETDLEPSREQLRRFAAVLDAAAAAGVDPGCVHAANSAGLLAGTELAGPATDAVRVGLALYGVRPSAARPADLRPVMTLTTRVAAVRSLRAGDPVGYGGDWRASRDTRIATLPLGYADGVPRAAAGRAAVLLAGALRPVVGRISMDYVTADAGDSDVAVGDEAVVFGPEHPVEHLAEAAGTIPYEILVGVGARVPRVYVD